MAHPAGRPQRRERHGGLPQDSDRVQGRRASTRLSLTSATTAAACSKRPRHCPDLFIDTGPVVQVKEVFGVKHLDDDEQGTAWDGPLVVLIDKLSASASEIFAGVIKDYGRGLIIGDASTFGKGTVQSIVMINDHFRHRDRKVAKPNRGALKLTIQQFFRANGDSTQINGVTPDIHMPSVHDFREFGEGKMDNALKFDKVPGLPHDNYNRAPADLVSRLNERSAERRKADPKFQKLDERIKKYLDRKARHRSL